jgi:hypothetical protein
MSNKFILVEFNMNALAFFEQVKPIVFTPCPRKFGTIEIAVPIKLPVPFYVQAGVF